MKHIYTKIALEHFALAATIPFSVVIPLSRGLSLGQVGILGSIIFFSTLLFEVASGRVADLYGRKAAMIISSLLFSVGFFIFAVATSFWLFAIAALTEGIAFAFLSGVDEAFIYDLVKSKDNENMYKKTYATATVVDEVATIVGLLISSLVASFGTTAYPYFISSGIMLATIFYIMFFLRENLEHISNPENISEHTEQNFGDILRKGLMLIGNNSHYILLFLALALLNESGRLLWQPQLVDVGFAVSTLGLVYAFLKLFSLLGAWFAGKLSFQIKKKHFIFLSLCSAIIFVVIGTNALPLSIIGFALYFFLENVFRVFQSDYLNARIASGHRATLLSLNSFFSSSFGGIFVLFLGYIADIRLVYGFMLIVIVKVIAGFLFAMLRNTRISTESQSSVHS